MKVLLDTHLLGDEPRLRNALVIRVIRELRGFNCVFRDEGADGKNDTNWWQAWFAPSWEFYSELVFICVHSWFPIASFRFRRTH